MYLSIIPFSDVLGLIAIIIGVVAIGFALKQYRDAKEQTNKLADLLNKFSEQTIALDAVKQSFIEQLSGVKESLSTQYKGVFPDFIPDIAELIKRSRYNLKIFCDFPAYGAFSNSKAFIKYKTALETLITENEHCHITLICMNATARNKMIDSQFPVAEWEEIKKDPVMARCLERFLNTIADNDDDPQTISHKQFKEHLEQRNHHIVSSTFKHKQVTVLQVNEPIPIYFWIRDDIENSGINAEAFVAIPSFTGKETEFGFLTQDQTLIRAISSIFKRYQFNQTPNQMNVH